MHRWSAIALALVLGVGLGAGALWLGVRQRLAPADSAPRAAGSEPAPPKSDGPRLTYSPEGEPVLRFETETQTRVGLEVTPLVGATRQPEVTAWGVLEEDPARSFTLRAPVAGVLRAAVADQWPDLNAHLDAGTLVGYLVPRLTQTEQLDLVTRLTQTRADAAEAAAALDTARSSYESKKRLNAEDKAVSDRALEEAEARLKSEEARLHAAQEIIRLIESARSAAGSPDTRFDLRSEQPGAVLETPVRPGEAVEAGQVLLRIASFDTLVARVELPVGTRFDEAAAEAAVVPVGDDEQQLVGERIGLAAGTSAAIHGPMLLYRVRSNGPCLRPGVAVVARVPAPGGPRSGVLVPRAAVIRLLGKTWVYVQTDTESFARRELVGGEITGDAWFAQGGLQPGDRVVAVGAQALLSEELKAQIEREEAAAN